MAPLLEPLNTGAISVEKALHAANLLAKAGRGVGALSKKEYMGGPTAIKDGINRDIEEIVRNLLGDLSKELGAGDLVENLAGQFALDAKKSFNSLGGQ